MLDSLSLDFVFSNELRNWLKVIDESKGYLSL